MSDHDNDKEWERLAAMIAEVKRHEEIAKAQEVFEPLYKSLKHRKKRPKVKRPSVAEVAIAQGILRLVSPEEVTT